MKRSAQVIVTIGPATASEQSLRQIKGKGVDFVRVNMSHSSLDDFAAVLQLSMKVGLPFIIDTEGSQVRTGLVREGEVSIDDHQEVRIHGCPVLGDSQTLCLRPASIIDQLEMGDLIHVDFDTLVLRVADTSSVPRGFVTAAAISGGRVGSNKAAVIDPRTERRFALPPLTDKDLEAIDVGLRLGVEHIAVSFVRSGASIDDVRRVTKNRMRLIAKIECTDALHNLDEILAKADAVLIDRGDLSKEIPVERIPFTQKIIMRRARRHGRDVYVATNLLETMVRERKPTRAEVQDVVNTLLDGAAGLTLAAETAVGAHPMECINVLNGLILHAERTLGVKPAGDGRERDGLIEALDVSGYLLDYHASTALVPPHGGRLVSRIAGNPVGSEDLSHIEPIRLDVKQHILLDQIAVGAFSPLEGFLGSADLKAVLENMRLSDGTVWPVPIVLDVPHAVADRLCAGQAVGLSDQCGDLVAILHLSELYEFDKEETAAKMYGTTSARHPGVNAIRSMQPVLLAGRIDLVKRRADESAAYELTPRQLRRLFAERGWVTVLGVSGSTVMRRGHEFIQRRVLDAEGCDGVFVRLADGDRGAGIKRCETMVQQYYPRNRVIVATVPACPRFTGPRETLLAALCHKNFGCSHVVAGAGFTRLGTCGDRIDHAGVLDRFPDLGIKALSTDAVCVVGGASLSRDARHTPGGELKPRVVDRGGLAAGRARSNTEEPVGAADLFGGGTTDVTLTPPYKGRLQSLMVSAAARRALECESLDLPCWDLTPRQVCDLELLLNGAFSPLMGYLGRADYERVCHAMRLQDGTLWPIPITLDVSREVAAGLRRDDRVALRHPEGMVLAVLTVSDIWEPDRMEEATSVYGCTDEHHPAVFYLTHRSQPCYVGGRVEGLELPPHHTFGALRHTPRELRAEFQKRGWSRVVALQTRNPMHRVHVELGRRAARDHEACLLIHPVVGLTKPGDLDYYTRVRCYQAVLEHFPEATTMLSLLPLAMRMGGPREALWHAIIRRNFGCSHMILGRDHAGPGRSASGKPFYEPHAAHELARAHQEELGVAIVSFEELVYVEDRAEYAPASTVPPSARVMALSGTELRRRLRERLDVPTWFSFPQVIAELRRSFPPRRQQGFTVFLTGLSGSGKSTIANVLQAKLLELGGRPVTLLDGDIVRKHLSSDLGFSREDRDLNVTRVGFVAGEITRHRGIAICALIAPYRATRRVVREMISQHGGFIEVHVATPLEECEARDRKGLYAKARAGLISDFTGVDDPYEAPDDAEIVLDTRQHSAEEAAGAIVQYLRQEGYLPEPSEESPLAGAAASLRGGV